MDALAIIPARGGSKGLPRKNVRPFCGKPLIAWAIEAALGARSIRRVVVSTDDPEIAEVSEGYGAQVVWRPGEISHDTAPSEAALLHALGELGIERGALAFMQCTSPLVLPEDVDGTLARLARADSAFTAAPTHRFLWNASPDGAEPVGHEASRRPMRQELDSRYVEVGAVYSMDIEGFLRARRRFFGRIDLYPIPPERSLEIDDETDFLLAESLMRKRLEQNRAALLPKGLKALVFDFDGVLTDNRVAVDEGGREHVVCHRGDGWAIEQLKRAGFRLAVLTHEGSPAVAHRCRKLGIERLLARGEKLPVLQAWLQRSGLEARHTLYAGNDLPDVPCMLHVGCGVAPSDALPAAKHAAQIVLEAAGGRGCVRELAGMILSILGGSHETTRDRGRDRL